MTTNSEWASAKIYAFPPRGRFAVGDRDETKSVVNAAPRLARAVAAGAWYHDEAIQEAERAGKN